METVRRPIKLRVFLIAWLVAAITAIVVGASQTHCEGRGTGFCTVHNGSPVVSWDMGPHGVTLDALFISVTVHN